MTFRPPNIPAGFGTKDTTTQEDLRRLRDVLRNLSVQMADLQAQIDAVDGGGGGTPDPHADSHENGGSDEINVGGLSGVLADPQRTDTIVESSGPTDLAVGGVADGEGFRRTGSTIAGASVTKLGYARPEIWTPPATAHASDDEFDSSTIPAGYTLFALTASTATPVTPITGIDLYTQPAAGNVRIEAHKDYKRSWLLMQPRAEAQHWFYGKKITLSGNNGWVFRTRLCTHSALAVPSTNNASNMGLMICKDDGSGNKPAIAAAAPFNPSNGIFWGWEADGAIMQIQTYSLLAGVPTNVTLAADHDSGTAFPYEAVIVLNAGAASNNWQVFMRTPNYTFRVDAPTAGTVGIKQGDTVWIGFDFLGIDTGLPSSPILSADYVRFENTAANFIP